MKLVIRQNTGLVETVNPRVLETIYNLKNANQLVNSNLEGHISTTYTYRSILNSLNTWFPDLQIDVDGVYVDFADANVESVLRTKGIITGDGITSDQAAAVSLPTRLFQNNTDITTFNEIDVFEKFIKCTAWTEYICDGATNLRSVDLTRVEGLAISSFKNCSSLTKFHGEQGTPNVLNLTQLRNWRNIYSANQFLNCLGIHEIQSLGTVQYIPSGCFKGCSNLTTVTLPPECTTLYKECFQNCSNLETINLGNITEIQDEALVGTKWILYQENPVIINGTLLHKVKSSVGTTYTLPSQIQKISGFAFSGIDLQVFNVESNPNLTSIGKGCFNNCSNLTSVTIPSSVSSIDTGTEMFSNCKNLTSITVDPNNIIYNSGNGSNVIIETATNTLLFGCKGSTIPSTVTKIKQGAFYRSGILSITIPNTVITFEPKIFENSDLSTVVFEMGCTTISEYMFQASNLTSATIPNTVTTIGNRCFHACKSFTSLYITDGVNTTTNVFPAIAEVPLGMFNQCAIQTMTLPSSVTAINKEAFNDCKSLTTLTINYTGGVVTLGTDALKNTTNLQHIYVPASLVTSYQSNSQWSSFSSKISAIPT